MKCRLEPFTETKGCVAFIKEAIDDEKRRSLPWANPWDARESRPVRKQGGLAPSLQLGKLR